MKKSDVNEALDKVRRICARLQDVSPGSLDAALYHAELQVAARGLMANNVAWDQASEPDKPQDGARQTYRSREKDSADGFADGMKLFDPKKPNSEKKKD